MSEVEKDLEVVWSDQVKEQVANDPEMAEALREFGAMMRQADAGVKSGQYKSMDDAIEALTGSKPELVKGTDVCDFEDKDESRH